MVIKHSLYDQPTRIEVDATTCQGCQKCIKICPSEILEMGESGVPVARESLLGCIACAHCMMVCPEVSIRVRGRGVCPDDLRELPPPESRSSPEALEALLRGRRSIRRFQPKEIPREALEHVVQAASSAPMGIPPWDVGVIVVAGREQVQQLAADVVKGYEQFLRVFRPWAISLMRPVMGRATCELFKTFLRPLAESLVRDRRNGRDTLFWDAPAVMLFHHSPYGGDVDSVIACTYAMLAAESLGLGTTIIGSAPPILGRSKALLRKYNVPCGNKPHQALILGYPSVSFRRRVERKFTSVRFL